RRGYLPSMLELIDARALDAVRPRASFPIEPGTAAAVLLEADGTAEEALANLLRMCEIMTECGGAAIVARNETQRMGMRRARRLVSGTLRELFPYKISDDVAVPRSRMPELLSRAHEAADHDGLQACADGHLGDGNLHLNLLCGSRDEQLRA